MNAIAPTATATAVSLSQMLVARERRAARQAAALASLGHSLVSITVVMPGPVKDGPLPRRLLDVAMQELDAKASAENWAVMLCDIWYQETGPEAIYIIAEEPQLVKLATIELEDHHVLGRLWDLDVIAPGQRPLLRKELSAAARRCLVCERPAYDCGRSRRHPIEELLDAVRKIVLEFDRLTCG